MDNPYQNIQPGVKPPLVKGMFVEVEIKGTPVPDQIVVPRSTVTNDLVYVVDETNRLQRREVKTKLAGANFLVVESGLTVGERIVVSDILPAIDGMLLEPVNDSETLKRLIGEAQANPEGDRL